VLSRHHRGTDRPDRRNRGGAGHQRIPRCRSISVSWPMYCSASCRSICDATGTEHVSW